MQCTDSGDAHAAHLSKESLTDESSVVGGEGLYSVVVEVLLLIVIYYSLLKNTNSREFRRGDPTDN